MSTSNHFERERAHYMAQMLEVRSTIADIGQRQQGLGGIEDSVAAHHLEQQLLAERAEALRELNRINEDLRKLALVEEARAAKERAEQQQAARAALEQKEAFAREDLARQESLQRETLMQREQEQEQQQELQRTETAARQAEADRSRENNPVADAVAGGIDAALQTPAAVQAGLEAAVKSADAWLEVKQLAEHYVERLALEARQRQEREQFDKEVERQRAELEKALLAKGLEQAQIEAELAKQAEVQARHREQLEAEQALERERQAERQAHLERERNERAERQGLGL